ncbi:MAG: polysaccharide deacetylase, partial [Acidobacteriia bacterium]|nr:polysaccharide deacetylase [Terriglobia bacterium]
EGRRPLTLKEAASAQSFQLTEAGYYQLRLANGRQNEVGVNPNPKESNLDIVPDDVLALWQGNGSQPAEQKALVPGAAAPGTTRQPLWWYFLLFGFLFALAESVLASRYLGTQREDS